MRFTYKQNNCNDDFTEKDTKKARLVAMVLKTVYISLKYMRSNDIIITGHVHQNYCN